MGNLSDKEKKNLERKARLDDKAAGSTAARVRDGTGVRDFNPQEAEFLRGMIDRYVKTGRRQDFELSPEELALLKGLVFVDDEDGGKGEDDSHITPPKSNNNTLRGVKPPPVETQDNSLLDSIPLELSEEDIQIGEFLGEGVYSTVYKGYVYGTQCAVKKFKNQGMDKHILEGVRKEVRIMKSIRHPNLLLFLGACTKPGHLMIVTELMDASFHDLNNNANFDLFHKLKMAKEAAKGISWLHALQPVIIHRDLKPENILIDSKGIVVKVADFGLSLVKDHSKTEAEEMKKIRGSPAFMSPEALRGEPLTPGTDVYSFGMILWELYTQLSPYDTLDVSTFEELIIEICDNNTREAIPQDCPAALRKLITQCWQKDPAKRPNFLQVIKMLDECLLEVAISDEEGRKWWKQSFSDEYGLRTEVPWPLFLQSLARFFGKKEDLKLWTGIKAMLLKENQGLNVRLLDWGNMLKWFGPTDSQQEETVLHRIQDLFGKRWFHGDISMEQAHTRLADNLPGTYLIRFSSVAGGYALSKITLQQNGEKKVLHIRIHQHFHPRKFSIMLDGKQKDYNTLQDLVNAPELNLKQPCPGSTYYAMMRVKVAAASGYEHDVKING
jgi:serine/threonine protein kinase